MHINNVTLTNVAVAKNNFPLDNLPEIAFIGKSNVGKSSLINTMVNRKKLARTSQNPGKTRTINFYNVEDKLYFVDLPGYGYAKVSKSESEKWGAMVEDYLLKREQLKLILFLIDIRHPPSKNDMMMFDFIKHYNHNLIIVLTKSDKLTRNQQNKNIAMFKKTFAIKDNLLIPFSSLNKDGKDVLWAEIYKQI